jgi:hypothetical protein
MRALSQRLPVRTLAGARSRFMEHSHKKFVYIKIKKTKKLTLNCQKIENKFVKKESSLGPFKILKNEFPMSSMSKQIYTAKKS